MMEMGKETVEGIFSREIYGNSQYGTTIALYKNKTGNEFTVTGTLLPTGKNITYHFEGEWVNHTKYGKQFKAESFNENIGDDKESIIAYLSSGLIPGVGKVLASKIVARFGKLTMEVMDCDIDRLSEVKGISVKKLEGIKKSYKQNRQAQDVILKLGKYGISPKLAMEVFQIYKDKSMDVIEHQSYKLSIIPGIPFALADSISDKTERYELDHDRFCFCARYVLMANERNSFRNIIGDRPNGSLGMDKDDFGRVLYHLLYYKSINTKYILDKSIQLIKEKNVVYRNVDGKSLFYLPGIYRIELETANHMYRLATEDVDMIPDLEKYINDAEMLFKIDLSDEQREAIKKAFNHNLSVVIGPPGTGKTLLIRMISYIYKRIFGKKMYFVAPSGRAASRIKETTGEDAATVHSALGIGTEILTDTISIEEYVIRDCLLVVDEMSMIDTRTAYRLFASIQSDCRIVICGDDEQLPSVGAGAVLRDIIDSRVLPMTYLQRVYRQSNDKSNYINSFLVRAGKTDLYYDNTFRFIEEDDPKQMENGMIQMYLEKVREYGVKNVMLISPFKEHDAGVKALNDRIQNIINPPALNRKEVNAAGAVIRIGDEVMNLKNDKENNVVNGEIGTVCFIRFDDSGFAVGVKFPDSEKEYTKDNINELTLAYAYTVHKAQGSEARCVITCIHKMHTVMLKRNIYYTAITRARDEVITYGQKSAMKQAIMTGDKSQRNTLLKILLRMRFGEFVEAQGA